MNVKRNLRSALGQFVVHGQRDEHFVTDTLHIDHQGDWRFINQLAFEMGNH